MIQCCRIAVLAIAMVFTALAVPVDAAPALGGGGTTATVDGTTVTITVHIDLCCIPEDAQRDIWVPLVRAEIKAAQDMWNDALAKLTAKGCFDVRVVFDARLLNTGDPWDPGYHQINIHFNTGGGKSYSRDPAASSPNSDTNTVYKQTISGEYYEDGMSTLVWAHEIGHLMGLGDDYREGRTIEFRGDLTNYERTICFPGREGTLMCSSPGTIDQVLADRLADILGKDGLLPQCWKGTLKIAAAMLGGAGRSDTWTADIKVVVSDKGVASGTGIANRASEVKFDFVPTGPVCPSVQAFTVKVGGDADKQSLRLKFGLTDGTPSAGTCDQTGFQLIFTGLPARINTIPIVENGRAEAHLEVRDMPGRSGSIDGVLDCTTCITAGAGAAP
jgi:hypothetical protein